MNRPSTSAGGGHSKKRPADNDNTEPESKRQAIGRSPTAQRVSYESCHPGVTALSASLSILSIYDTATVALQIVC